MSEMLLLIKIKINLAIDSSANFSAVSVNLQTGVINFCFHIQIIIGKWKSKAKFPYRGSQDMKMFMLCEGPTERVSSLLT